MIINIRHAPASLSSEPAHLQFSHCGFQPPALYLPPVRITLFDRNHHLLMQHVSPRNICRYCLLLTCMLLANNLFLGAQQQRSPLPGYSFTNNSRIDSQPARNRLLSETANINVTTTSQRAPAPCFTSNFYIHLTQTPGQQIKLSEIQTLPNGNFILAGTSTTATNEKEGYLAILSNNGTILSQHLLRIANKQISISDMKILLNGTIGIVGIIHDATEQPFIALLDPNLTLTWLRVISGVLSPIQKVTLATVENTHFTIAASSGNTVTCALFTTAGALEWCRNFNPPGMTSLVGFGQMSFWNLGLITQSLQSGKQQVHITEINGHNGTLLRAHTMGDGVEENISGEVHEFNGRMRSIGIQQPSPGQFRLTRNIFYGSDVRETKHVYSVPLPIDFNTSCAMDNAGDVMGFCLPADGKLIFLRQHSDYQTTPEHARSYNVPVGSNIAAVARSFIDGGFLFGLNTAGANELILLKTDSIGTLSGCGSTELTVASSETTFTPNTASTSSATVINLNLTNDAISFNPTTLGTQTDCSQQFCPDPPAEDTCLSTYQKAMRSNSFADGFRNHMLMRNNQHLVVATRYDRILGNQNQLTYSLKLFDERANYIKGSNIFHNGISSPIYTHKIDSMHFMMISRTPINGVEYFTFTKMNDDLTVLWSQTARMPPGISFSHVFEYDDFVTDSSGNHYLIGTTLGFSEPPKVHVYKMGPTGNPLWIKTYASPTGLFLMASATATYTSIIVVVEGSSGAGGSFSLDIDQATGNLKHAYRYANGSAGAGYYRTLSFDGQRIFYAGNADNSEFVMATFDTTGRPYRFKRIANSTNPQASTVNNNKLYSIFWHYDGTEYKDVILKADSTLTVELMSLHDKKLWGAAVGMDIGSNGSIYIAGNRWDYNTFWDPDIRKLDENASLGTCPSLPVSLPVTDVVLGTVPHTFTETSANNAVLSVIPVNLLFDLYGPAVSQVLCSSMPLCNDIEASGPISVCRLNQPYTYKGSVNTGCTGRPSWIYDTAFVNIIHSAADSVVLSFKRTGTTSIIAKLNSGCTQYYDTIEVTIQSNPALVSLGSDRVLCPGDTIYLDPGTGFHSYQWQDGSNSQVMEVTQPGQYIIQADNICGDIAKDTVVINAALVPILALGDDVNLCAKDTLHLQAAAGFTTYLWQSQPNVTGSGAQVYVVAADHQTISIDAITNDGCHARDTLAITVMHPRPVSLGNDTSFCSGNQLLLQAGNGYLAYQWSNGTTTNTLATNQAGTYWVHATDVNGCVAKDTMVIAAVHALPSFTLGADFDLCTNESKRLDPGNFAQYRWQDNSTSRNFTVTATGTYWVTVTDQNQCSASDTVLLRNILPVPGNFLKTVDSVCQYDHISLAPEGNFNSYLWSNGSSQSSISVQAPGQYVLTVRDANGCNGKDTITVVQKTCYIGIYVPTAFTPNNDSRNDLFKARVYGVALAFRMRVYNRWGELVFETTDPMRGWDGRVKGVSTDSGVFIWQCSYHLQGSSPQYQKGTVTLIR